VPKPVLPLGCICHKCRMPLTQKQLDSFSVGYSDGTTKRKWGPCGCGHKQSSSVGQEKFAIMLSLLSVFERFCVLISVANFAAAKMDIAAAKKAVKLQLAADAVEMEDGPLDGEPDDEAEEESEEK
jgi:hypothetical protein